MTDTKPCPFCGGTDLVDGSWYVDDTEVEAFECSTCKAGAPVTVWSDRAADDITARVRTMRALQIEYFRTRDPEMLRRSKEAERELDAILTGFMQPDIFYQEASA